MQRRRRWGSTSPQSGDAERLRQEVERLAWAGEAGSSTASSAFFLGVANSLPIIDVVARGIANDGTPIGNRLNVLIESVMASTPGAVFFFRAGTYQLTESVLLRNGVRLVGSGELATTLRGPLTDSLIRCATPEPYDSDVARRALYVMVTDLTVDNVNAATSMGEGAGIDFRQVSRSVVTRCRALNCATGLQSYNYALNNSFEQIDIIDCTTGVHIGMGSNQLRFESVRVTAPDTGFHLDCGPDGDRGCNAVAFHNCEVNNFTANGWYLDTVGAEVANLITAISFTGECRAENQNALASTGVGIYIDSLVGRVDIWGFFAQALERTSGITDDRTNSSGRDGVMLINGRLRGLTVAENALTSNAYGRIRYNNTTTALEARTGTDSTYASFYAANLVLTGDITCDDITTTGNITMPVGTNILFGDGTASGNAGPNFRKADANNMSCINFQVGTTNRWIVQFTSAEHLSWLRRDASGNALDTPLQLRYESASAAGRSGIDGTRHWKTQGTAVVAGDVTLSAGWGNTATVAIATGSNDSRGQMTITANGTGIAANPTVTLTYHDGTWTTSTWPMIARNGGTDAGITGQTVSGTATTFVVTMVGTPTAGNTVILRWSVDG